MDDEIKKSMTAVFETISVRNDEDKKISLSVKELLPAPEYTDDVAEDTEE